MERHWTNENLELVFEACYEPDFLPTSETAAHFTIPTSTTQVPQSSSQRHNFSNNKKIHPSYVAGGHTRSSSNNSLLNDLSFAIPAFEGEMKTNRDSITSPFEVPPPLLGSPTFEFPSPPAISADNLSKPRGESSLRAYNDVNQVFSDPTVFDHEKSALASSSNNQENRGDADKLNRYLVILDHASSCFERRCSLKECHKMRAFIGHVNRCPHANNGCRLCRRFFVLSRMHASRCNNSIGHCPVLYCGHFKLENIS